MQVMQLIPIQGVIHHHSKNDKGSHRHDYECNLAASETGDGVVAWKRIGC